MGDASAPPFPPAILRGGRPPLSKVCRYRDRVRHFDPQHTSTPRRSHVYIGLGIALLVIGAILYFAVTASIGGISISMIGLILMIGGVLAILLSFLQQAGNRSRGITTTRETSVDPGSGSRIERTDVDPH